MEVVDAGDAIGLGCGGVGDSHGDNVQIKMRQPGLGGALQRGLRVWRLRGQYVDALAQRSVSVEARRTPWPRTGNRNTPQCARTLPTSNHRRASTSPEVLREPRNPSSAH